MYASGLLLSIPSSAALLERSEAIVLLLCGGEGPIGEADMANDSYERD